MPIIVVPIDKAWRGVHIHIAESTDRLRASGE